MKKIIALILCFSVLISVCSISGFAVETNSSPYRIKNIPETLQEIAIMIGELPYLIILAFSLGGLFWLTPIIHLFVS